MSMYVKLAAAAAMALGLSFGTAQAVTTTIFIGGTDITVQCVDTTDPVCQGFTGGGSPGFPTGAGILSSTSADLYSLGNANEATETAALNTLISGDPTTPYTTADANKTESGIDEDSHSFFSSAAHIAFKIGGGQLDGNYFFLALLSPGLVEVIFDRNNVQSGGLSHFTEFGTTTVVPLPAGLLLFLTGLAGVGFLGRYNAKRRREPELV